MKWSDEVKTGGMTDRTTASMSRGGGTMRWMNKAVTAGVVAVVATVLSHDPVTGQMARAPLAEAEAVEAMELARMGLAQVAVLLVGEIEDHGVCCRYDVCRGGGTIRKLGGRLECGVLKPDGVVISFAVGVLSRAE